MAETTHLIEVSPQVPGSDPGSRAALAEVRHLGAAALSAAARSRLYRLSGPLSPEDARRIAAELLSDPITEVFTLNPDPAPRAPHAAVVDVWYRPGVTDPAAWTIEEALKGLGYPAVRVRCGERVRFTGRVPPARLEALAGKFLGNAVIQEWSVR